MNLSLASALSTLQSTYAAVVMLAEVLQSAWILIQWLRFVASRLIERLLRSEIECARVSVRKHITVW